MNSLPSYRQSIHGTSQPIQPPRYGVSHTRSQSVSSIPSRPSSSTAPEHIVSTKHIILNLGPNHWGTRAPSYGRNDIVSGYVDLRKLDNAKRVDIQLVGTVITWVTDRGEIVVRSQRKILSQSKQIYSSGSDDAKSGSCSTTATSRFPFSLQFPDHIDGSRDALPPSFSANHPQYHLIIQYAVKVDMYKKGLRMHESLEAEILYLPMSFSMKPDHYFLGGGAEVPINFGRPEISGQLQLSGTKHYPVGSEIPFSLSITSPSLSLLSQLVNSISVELVRYITIVVEGKRSTRETVVGKGEVWDIHEAGDTRVIQGAVKGGKPGGEFSWRVLDLAEIKYFVRLTFRKDARSSLPPMPEVLHEERITLTTHDYSDDHLGSTPALDMIAPTAPTSPSTWNNFNQFNQAAGTYMAQRG